MFAKTVIFDDKTDVRVYSVALDDLVYNIVICEDSEMFSTELLRRLLLSSNGEQIAAAAAVSGRAEDLSVKAVFLGDPDVASLDFALRFFAVGLDYFRLVC